MEKVKRIDIYNTLKIQKNINKKNKKRHNYIKNILNLRLEPYIIKIKENMIEKESYKLEENYITEIGLDNLTNIVIKTTIKQPKGYKHTKKTIEKISNSSKNKVLKDFILINPNGQKYTNISLSPFCIEHKLNYDKIRKFVNRGKIKLKNGGFKPKQETINCIGWEVIRPDIEKPKPKINYILTSPNGEVFEIDILNKFCEKYNLNYRTIKEYRNMGKIKIKLKTATEYTKNCNGWVVVNINNASIANKWKSKRKNKYIIISPKGKKYTTNNIIYFCDKNKLNLDVLYKNINKGRVKQNNKRLQISLNTVGWSIETIGFQ